MLGEEKGKEVTGKLQVMGRGGEEEQEETNREKETVVGEGERQGGEKRREEVGREQMEGKERLSEAVGISPLISQCLRDRWSQVAPTIILHHCSYIQPKYDYNLLIITARNHSQISVIIVCFFIIVTASPCPFLKAVRKPRSHVQDPSVWARD